MNIQEILNMVDEDIARAEEQQPDNKEENIDFLLSELEASRELDEDRLAEKYLAMHTMYQFLTRPGNLIKILDCKDQLTLGECLPMLTYLPWVKDTEFERLCLEASFCSLYNHFQYGNELEKGFAAIATIKLLLHHSEQLLPCFEEFQQIAYENEHLHKQMDEVDFQYEPQILLYQVQASMVPFVRRVYEMYPMLEEERINEFYTNFFVENSDGLYERYEEFHYEKGYTIEEIKELLGMAGLEFEAVYDELTFEEPKENSQKVFFVAKVK